MEKLIELLNEREELAPSRLQRKYYSEGGHIMYVDEEGEDIDDYRTDYEIVSKDYGFIKRLVDNDKINFNKVDRIGSGDFLYPMDTLRGNVTCEREYFEEYNEYDRLVMLLAISEQPLEDLISYL